MTKHFFLPLAFIFSFLSISFSQTIELTPTLEPEFFEPNQSITITYDVTGTIMHDWQEAWIWMWVPSANNANVPTNVNPANSNATLTNAAKFTKSEVGGQQLFSLTIVPADFVGLADFEDLGMLIKGNDWSNGQSNDYVVEVGVDFRIIFENPTESFAFYENGETINTHIKSTQPADLSLYVDDNLLSAETNVTELLFDHEILADGDVHILTAIGTNGIESDTLRHTYTVQPTTQNLPLPTGGEAGLNYDENDDTKATLVLTAPTKDNVFVIGDFNNWQLDSEYLMNRDGDDFWLAIENLIPNQEYRFQYLVDGEIKIADPYTEKVSSQFDDGEIIQDNRYPGLMPYPNTITSEAISYLQTGQEDYVWTASNYQRPPKENLVIYELLIRDFTDERTFQAVIDRLDYLDGLGINAIELMPVMEFEGNLSWGYNPAFMLAVDKFYGTENKLRELIDEAHSRGMAVILDIVLNHSFGRGSLVRLNNEGLYGSPTADNVWLNQTAKHDFNVGYDFNHESLYTQYYTDRVNEFWIKEFNIDGFRFDLSKGFTQKNTLGNTGAWGNYDASRIALLKRMADHIWSVDPDNYVILEHFADNGEERELADYGMLLWGNMNHSYRTAGKGNPTNLEWVYHEERGWDNPHVIGYMESHDEERFMWDLLKSGSFTLEGALDRAKLASAFFFLVPGPKMIWQFGEMGYEEELNNDRLGVKPTHWEYLDIESRKRLVDFYTSMIRLKTETPYVKDGDFTWDAGSYVRWLNIDHPDVKIAAFGNFRKSVQTDEITWPSAGTWYHYFTGETIEIDNPTNYEVTLEPGELQIYTSMPIDNYINYNPLPTFGEPPVMVEEIQLSPNPVTDELTIEYPLDLESLKLYTADGKWLRDIEIDTMTGATTIDLFSLANGVYIISSKSAEGRVTRRFVKN